MDWYMSVLYTLCIRVFFLVEVVIPGTLFLVFLYYRHSWKAAHEHQATFLETGDHVLRGARPHP